MKKIFLFTSLFVFSLLIWSPKISLASLGPEPEEVFNGSGTENNPFEITTCEQLQNVGHYSSENYYFILNNNIDCSDTINWNDGAGFWPIGYSYDTDTSTEYGNIFIGNFNGNNHTISNLYINRPTYDYVGLFGQVEQAEIINIGLIDVNITGNNIVGGLVGSNIQGHIENTYTTGNVIGQIEVGGLVGESSDTPFTITGSHSEADVGGIGFIGGLVGSNFLSNIYNSYATGDITGSYQNIPAPYQGFGGLVGINVGGHIEDTYATGDVEGIFAGGLVGTTVGYDTIVSSYATGDVTGSVVGGLVGYNNVDDIHNSYSTGKVIGEGSELFESMKIGMGGEELADVYYIAGGLIGVMIYEGESVDNYVFNSGWYQSRDNSNLSGIGMVGYSDDGIIFEGPAEVTYTETNNRAFYSKNHGVYDQTGEYVWNFNGNPWYEYSNDYPKFVEQEGGRRTGRSSGGSGSSTAVIASFQAEQLARAIATGVDTTPYLNPSNSSGQVPNPQPSVSDGQSPTFGRTLKQGMTGEDVRQLQIYLNTHGYPVATEGDGSLNHETTYFGLKTKQAVIKFQIANGLISDGVVGPLTQSKMN